MAESQAAEADAAIIEVLRESESTVNELAAATSMGERRIRRALARLLESGQVAKDGQYYSLTTTQFAYGSLGAVPTAAVPTALQVGLVPAPAGEALSFERRMSQQLAKLLDALKKAVAYFDPGLVAKLDKRMADEHDPAEAQLREWAFQLNRLAKNTFQAARQEQEHLAALQQEAIETGQYAEQLKKQVLKYKADWETFTKQAEEWGQDLIDAAGLLNSLDTGKFKAKLIMFNALDQPRIIKTANELIGHLDEATKKEVRWNLLGNSKLKFW